MNSSSTACAPASTRLPARGRQARSISYRISGAKFPVLKDLDKFVFAVDRLGVRFVTQRSYAMPESALCKPRWRCRVLSNGDRKTGVIAARTQSQDAPDCSGQQMQRNIGNGPHRVRPVIVRAVSLATRKEVADRQLA